MPWRKVREIRKRENPVLAFTAHTRPLSSRIGQALGLKGAPGFGKPWTAPSPSAASS